MFLTGRMSKGSAWTRRRWQLLHRLIYLIALLGVIHFLWLVKKDLTEPLIYAAVLALLFIVRLPWGVTLLLTVGSRLTPANSSLGKRWGTAPKGAIETKTSQRLRQ